MKSVGSGIGTGFEKVSSLAAAPFQPGVPVVEAREEALREMPLGRDQALAYQAEQRRRRSFWIFGGPVDFQEPTLPEGDTLADGGLLPPKID